MYNFYSSGDEVLELGPQGITVLDWDASVRQYTWHKQEAFKGRNVLYGSGWAGWGFESNVTAQAVNAASPETLRDFPIFEHDPDEMFSATIATNMQNRILAKGIPALSKPVGRGPEFFYLRAFSQFARGYGKDFALMVKLLEANSNATPFPEQSVTLCTNTQ